RTTTEAHVVAVVEQHSLRRDQPERSEDEGLFIHRKNRPWEGLLIQNTRTLATRYRSIGHRSRNCALCERGTLKPAHRANRAPIIAPEGSSPVASLSSQNLR